MTPISNQDVLAPRLQAGHRALVVIAHADDATLFCGGTIAGWADLGVKATVLRVTDDAPDSVGLDRAATRAQNSAQLRAACAVLGVYEALRAAEPQPAAGS